MNPADLSRALERLRGSAELYVGCADHEHDVYHVSTEPLAALIEAAAGIHIKPDRDGKPVIIGMLPLSDALAALVAAVNGGSK